MSTYVSQMTEAIANNIIRTIKIRVFQYKVYLVNICSSEKYQQYVHNNMHTVVNHLTHLSICVTNLETFEKQQLPDVCQNIDIYYEIIELSECH